MNKILIVDDERLIIEHVSKLLDGLGYEYDFIPRPKFLYPKLEQDKFDLILLDINMAGEDGVQILENLKKDERYKHISVIMMTGESSQNVISNCFELGASDYITKPIRDLEFSARVSSVVKLKTYMEEINSQKAELEKNQKIIIDTLKQLKDKNQIIEKKNSNIQASINSAKRIQNAILPNPDYMKNYIKDLFVFLRPRDTVSGDFYWFSNLKDAKNKFIIIGADCTGHGIPGAFMTALGSTLFKEIIDDRGITEPNLILYEINKSINSILSQEINTDTDVVRDGMEAAVCLVDKENKSIQFSGANLPLLVSRNNDVEMYRGTRKAIGIQLEKAETAEYELQTLDIQDGDIFYITSDGLQDQFDHENAKKFSRRRVITTLYDLSKRNLDLSEQCKELEKIVDDWMGDTPQIDDMLLIGFSVL